ncbi:MAG TPA: homocysteine S-methyltransferase family protein [Anaerolineae bacterium]|nr:homocysteine S-methyltransferase family protein [Anaerolineae bacterium]
MNFAQALQNYPFILAEGAIIERLRRDPAMTIDPHIANGGLIYSEAGRTALRRIYTQYLDIGKAYNLPMITLTPTWRATPERLHRAGFADAVAINGDGARFLAETRISYGSYAGQVFIGGLMGCRGDAYNPTEALRDDEATEFHRLQARALAAAGVDFLMGSTLPAFSEALGMARAMAETGAPYLLSFVLRPTGTLLDGTPLHAAIARIDAAVSPHPCAYMANCVHPRVYAAALNRAQAQDAPIGERLIGLQANTSAKSPEELDGLESLDSEAPAPFAAAMLDVRRQFGAKILGGCCGSDERHIEAIAAMIAAERSTKHDSG